MIKLTARFSGGLKDLKKLQGGWVAFAYFIVTLILTIALSPKPPKPKAAALEDFDLPVAEEDRPIPVLFGTWRITGANVVWYGDLRTTKIKKSGLTGSTTIGYKYYLGMHMALGHGPFDAVTRIETADKIAWNGNITSNGSAVINLPDLYGGKSREGGIVGVARVLMGAPAQTVDTYLDAKQPGPTPAYRGVVSIVWSDGGSRGGYIGNTPYVKAWAVTCRRVLKGWTNDTPWYPEKAQIGTGMNPAHIIYQCLTDSEWGQGSPTGAIDADSFTDAADALFDENFGLNMLWNQSTSIEAFIGLVLDHIGGMLTFNQQTGQYMLKLVRGDYNPDSLPTFGPGQISEVTNFERRSWGETVNELAITFTDRTTRKPTAMVVQDLGNIRSQGQRINEKLDFSGIDDPDLQRVVAGRELAARSTPLARFDFRANRQLWRYGPGDVIKITWPEYELEATVFRILDLRRGTLKDGKMTVSVVEDIYGLPGIEYTADQDPSDDEEPPFDPFEPDGSPNVISNDTNIPPANPEDGDRYFIPVSPPATGAWAGHEGEIAEWDEDENEWIFVSVPPGQPVYNEGDGQHFGVDEYGEIVPVPWTPAIPPLPEVEDTFPDLSLLDVVVYDTASSSYKKIAGDRIGGSSSPTTTKGDLIVRGQSQDERLPVGAAGYILTPDPDEDLGLKWTPPSALQALYYNKSTTPAGDTIANSSAETTFQNFYSAIAGNQLAVGDRIIVKAAGVYGTTGTPTLRLRLKLGSTTVLDTGAVTQGNGITARGWVFEGMLAVTAVGAGGTVEAHGHCFLSTAAGTMTQILVYNAAAISVDTSLALDVSLTALWGTANAANTITARQMSVTIENVRPATGADPLFSLVRFLSGFEGVDGATALVDESSAARTITFVGNAQIDTAQFKFGASSLLLDGNGDYVTVPDDASLTLGASDFCIEGFIRFNGDPSGGDFQTFVSHYLNTGNDRAWYFGYDGANDRIHFSYSADGATATIAEIAWNPATATWYHVAVTRQGANLRLFVDGVLLLTHNIGSTTIFNSTQPVTFGRLNSAGFTNRYVNGWMDEWRITIGAPRYTAAFTAPTSAFPRS